MTSASSPASSDRYVVATDGACKGNPGPAGWAWVGEDGHWAAGSIPEGTNNIGELLGLLHAITDHAEVRELVVQADSKYAIDTYSSWMDGHRRRGWVTSAKKPVANRGILEALIAARDARRAAGLPDVVLEHVRGHSGHVLNSWADERGGADATSRRSRPRSEVQMSSSPLAACCDARTARSSAHEFST